MSIILVNFNTTGLLLDCLASVDRHFEASSYEVIVVDNASEGFDPAQIVDRHPDVRVVTSGQNLGFGRANNLGAASAVGNYLWLLNTDTLIPPANNLGRILDHLDCDPRCAAAAPLLVNERDDVQSIQRAYFPTLPRMALEKLARRVVSTLPRARSLCGRLEFNFRPLEEGDVPVVVAASLFVRRRHFEEVGGFSPEYFMYLEDSDLCRKFAERGYTIRFMPQARVVHFLGGSLADNQDRKRLFVESQALYFQKWSMPWAAAIVGSLTRPLLLLDRLRGAAGARR